MNDRTAEQFFRSEGFDNVDKNREFQTSRQMDRMIWDQLMVGGNGVRKRVALALSEFFVVSVNQLDIVWPAQAIGAYWDMLNEHAFGNFRDLLEAVTFSPAMAAFLDTIGNRKANPSTGRVPDENFARELMQLFTIGLYELDDDGSPIVRNGRPIETYNNSDVEGLAKVFTGLDLDASGLSYFPDPANGRPIPEVSIVRRRVTANPKDWQIPEAESQHSTEAKSFLGRTIPAGTDSTRSIKIALDVLFDHKNLPPFFCKQMIQRLTTSNPSPDYIRRVSSVFKNDGRGNRGNLAAVFKAILLDQEAVEEKTLNDFRFGKLREPTVRFVQLGRQFGLASKGGIGVTRNISNLDREIGQVPFRAPSVFNFFRPSFAPPRSVTAKQGYVGPEFQLVHENSVAAYINFIFGTIVSSGYWMNDWTPDFSKEIDIAHDVDALVSRLDLRLTGGQLRDSTIESIVRAVSDLEIDPKTEHSDRFNRSALSVFMIFISNDYIVQK